MGGEDASNGFCCGTCELAELTVQGKVSFEQSPHLVIGDDDSVVVIHERVGGPMIIRRLPLHRGQRFVVGRRAEVVDVVLESRAASARIFALEVTATGAVFIEDVGSACGTLVNGRVIERARLNQRDQINVAGNTFFTFQQGDERGTPTVFERVAAEWAAGAPAAGSPPVRSSSPREPAVGAIPEGSPVVVALPALSRRHGIWRWLRSR